VYYLTTAIDYTNGSPHIGHAYEKILSDILVRYQRLKGVETFFLTGVDQHGQKVQQSAEKEGIHPATYAAKNTKKFKKLWEQVGLDYDGWAETTDDRHKACVCKILTQLKEQGQLYKKAHKGFYSVRQEQFLNDRDRNEQGEFGAEWGEVVELAEENWYFKLSDHAQWLQDYLEKTPDCVYPSFRQQEVINSLEKMQDTDLCISRPKARLFWGIEFPFDPEYVTYVWFDALINYLSFAGYLADPDSELPDFDKVWERPVHVIGKDILVPAHAIYWMAMLHALGFNDEQMPQFVVHGFWNAKGEKMSKSIGNIIDPKELADTYGVDALRYYLARDIHTGKDADFLPDRFISIFQTELANDLGNLCNRTLNMAVRYCADKTLATPSDYELVELDKQLQESLAQTKELYKKNMDTYQVSFALEAINKHVKLCNSYAEANQPWALAKDEANTAQLHNCLYHIIESLAHIALLLSPVLPDASAKILHQIGASDLATTTLDQINWGLIQQPHLVNKPKPIFPRIQLPETEKTEETA